MTSALPHVHRPAGVPGTELTTEPAQSAALETVGHAVKSSNVDIQEDLEALYELGEDALRRGLSLRRLKNVVLVELCSRRSLVTPVEKPEKKHLIAALNEWVSTLPFCQFERD